MADPSVITPPTIPTPKDPLIGLLNTAVATLPPSPFADLLETIRADSQQLIQGIMQADTGSSADPADPDVPPALASTVAPFFQQRSFDWAKAKAALRSSLRAASAPLDDEVENWETALAQYDLSISSAVTTLIDANTTAWTTYSNKYNTDSASRAANLRFELQGEIAAATLAYTSTAASAGSTLAAEAGTLMAAYATFVGAVEQAQAQYQLDEATAGQNFWQGVEGLLDAP